MPAVFHWEHASVIVVGKVMCMGVAQPGVARLDTLREGPVRWLRAGAPRDSERGAAVRIKAMGVRSRAHECVKSGRAQVITAVAYARIAIRISHCSRPGKER